MKKLIMMAVVIGSILPLQAQFTQDFEASNGNRGYDWGNCWQMGAIAYRSSASEVISGNWSARSNQLTNESLSACWIKTPWLTWSSGNVSLDFMATANNGNSRGIAIRMIPYDAMDANYEGTYSDTIFYYDLPMPFTTSPQNLSFAVPAQFQDGNPYRMMISFVGKGGNSRIISDNYSFPATYWSDPADNCKPLGTSVAPDADGDGVADVDDDFPNDANLAYRVVFPAPSTFATVAFEDLWPAYGDYDFNDLVVDYQIEMLADANNDVSNVNLTFYTRAVGAGIVNGFGFEVIGILPTDVSNVTGTILTEGFVTNNANGTEAGQPNATIIVYDNVENVINRVGASFYNTVAGEPMGISDTQVVSVTFASPMTLTALNNVTFNPFLIKDRTRGIEVHLPDLPPTALADQSLFGTVDDDSDAGQNRYYKSPDNLPWALELSSRFDYPTEKTDILDAYLDFASWAQSSGQQKSDWFVPSSGRRNESNIY
jgi:LruC domain-containing protein